MSAQFTGVEAPVLIEIPADKYKKQNGVFYTTGLVLDILCEWAIRSPEDTVLEPSFGGCGFLEASVRRLAALRCTKPLENLCGCDLDALAFNHLEKLIGNTDVAQRFLKDDFLKVKPNDFLIPSFRAIIGNPPYVSQHNMTPQQKRSAFTLGDAVGLKNRKASLWAYFVRHSLNFLEKGGRMAWVLPGSLLHAEYGTEIRNALRYYFRRSISILVGERLFLNEGTEEQSVVLLCDDFFPGNDEQEQKFGFANNMSDLANMIASWQAGQWQGYDSSIRPNLALLNGAGDAFEELSQSGYCYQLGQACDVRIGLVTGANRFFVLDQETANSFGLTPDLLTFTLGKFTDACGLDLDGKDQQDIRGRGKKCLLVDTSRMTHFTDSLSNYLSTYPQEKKAQNRTFEKRQQGKLWHRPNDGSIPDAFFPYMQKDGPALLLNTSAGTSTNSVHRVYFNEAVDEAFRMALAVSMLSTFSQLSAEIEGRSYGSGVLKHEPSEAKRIQLLIPSIKTDSSVREVFSTVDRLMRSGETQAARQVADVFVLGHLSEHEQSQHISVLTSALGQARSRRQRYSH